MYTMSGYRCVNYYELCRLCTASHGIKKVNIFGEEGRRCNLYEKIAGCLPIDVSICGELAFLACIHDGRLPEMVAHWLTNFDLHF